jgi:hypothetical protein
MLQLQSYKLLAGIMLGLTMNFSLPGLAECQELADNVDVSFGIKSWDPVHIIVEDKTGSAFSTPIRFTAINSTYYTFKLTLDFSLFENLSPRPSQREIKLTHGINNLYTFSVHVPERGYGYKYSYQYWLAPSSDPVEVEYPYLIPLKEGRTVNAKSVSSGKIRDSFIADQGDTVFCMRRGIVTAVPRQDNLDFRISEHNCLEVLHNDGTVMIYHYLDRKSNFCAPGKIVLPGQPVGLVSDSSYFKVTLLKITSVNNILTTMSLRYTIGDNKIAPFDDLDGKIKAVYPIEIIRKELTGKEVKRARIKD